MQFNQFNKLKIGTKLGIGMGFVLCLMLAAMFTFDGALNKVGRGYRDMLAHEYAIQEHAHQVNEFMLQCRRNEKDFLLRHKKKYLDKLKDNVGKLQKAPNIL